MSDLDIGVLNSNQNYSGLVDSTDPFDLYKFSLNSPGKVGVSLSALTANADLEVLDNQGGLLYSLSPSDLSDEVIAIDNLAAGNYTIRVKQVSGEANYNLSLTVENIQVDPLTGLNIESGYFTVGETGQVGVDFINDGGWYKGELAIFSLDGMDRFVPGSEEFIKEAAHRALSNSNSGYLIISDPTEAAKFNVGLANADNDGEYKGVKTFAMKPGDTFGVMLVPNGKVQEVFDNPNIGAAKRPLFSLVTANPNEAFHVGQIADINGTGSAFAIEDMRVDTGTDKDYNDVVFKLTGATGKAVNLDDVIDPGKDWRDSNLGKDLIGYVKGEFPVDPKPVDPKPVDPKPVDPTPVDPTPVDPTPVDPTPVNPTPVDPTPVNPTPVNPTPVNPTPVDPTPVDPTPVNPTPVNPTPQIDPNQPLIGLIDTGFSGNNADLDYRRFKLGSDRISNDDNPLLSFGEGNEHGTHILGLIAATQGNGIGIDGINDKAPIWLGRAVGSGNWADSLIEFVDAAKQSGQKNSVVNLSLDLTQINPDGSITTRYELTPKEREAIEYARQNHVLIVTAAGNDGGVMSVLGQASQEFDNIITVGASDESDRANYSSYGAGLDIVTEGGNTDNPVLSTVKDGVGMMAGTSVAAARATGVASLVWAANPDLSYRQVIDILELTAVDVKTPGWDAETGAGLLNVVGAIELAKKTTPQDYNPKVLLTPETWSGEGKVIAIERAVDNGQSVELEWIRQLGTPGRDLAVDVAVDSLGNIYATGRPGGSLAGNGLGYGTWVAKYDRSGTQQWIRQFGYDNSNGVGVDNSGNVYIAGGDSYAWLAKYDNNGNLDWIEELNSSYDERATSVAVDNSGNIYMTGFTEGSLNGTNAGYKDAWVAKYNTYGERQWVRQLGTSDWDQAWGTAVDSTGNVYITGSTSGALGGAKIGGSDAWVAKYDSNGNRQWTRQLGTTNQDDSYGVAVDGVGNVYITGGTAGSLGGTNNGGSNDAWVAKYSSGGNLLWTRQLGTPAHDDSYGVAVDSAGNVYITGNTYSSLGTTAGLGGTNAGWEDAYVAKYDSNGTVQWIKQLGTATTEMSFDVAADTSGNVYISGITEGSLEGTQAGNGDAFIAKYGQAPADDTLATARDIGSLNGNRTLSGFVGSADTQDYYRFSVNTPSDFSLLLNGLSADANVSLLDSSGTVIQSSINGSTTTESISRTLNTGSYYLRIYPGVTGANTNYNISLSATPTAPPDTVGNDANTARNLGLLNGTQTFSEFVGNADNYDYYRFNLDFDNAFSLSLKGVSTNGTSANPDVHLFRQDSNGLQTEISNAVTTNSGEVILSTNLGAGTYFVRVGRNSEPIINSTYNLSLSATPIDAGNTIADARYIGTLNSGIQTFRDTIGNSDSNDYYRFDLNEGSDLHLRLDGLTAPTDVQVFRADGNTIVPVGGQTGNQNAAELNLILSSGTHYIRVSPNSSGNNTAYNLSLSATFRSPRDLDINIGNQTYGSGANIFITGRVYDPDGASDLKVVQLQLSQEGGEVKNYNITNFTPSSQNPHWAEFTYDLGRLAPGKYGYSYVAYDKTGGKSGTTLSTSTFDVVYSAEDYAGNTPNQARNIGTLSGTHTFSDFVGTTDFNDYYRFTVPDTTHFSGTTNVRIQLDGLSGDADLTLLKLNSNGTTTWLQGSSLGGTTSETITQDLAAGTYLVDVSSGGVKLTPSNPNTNYTLNVSIPTLGTLGSNQTINGSLRNIDPQDTWNNPGHFYQDYRLTGFTPGQKVKLTLNASGFDPYLLLLNTETGVSMAQSIVRNGNSTELEFTVPSNWNNTVRVTSHDLNATGSYTITATPFIPGFMVGFDSDGNNYAAFNTAAQYYGVAGNPTGAVYRSSNGLIQEFYAADGFGKYFLMKEDGSANAFLLGGAPLEYYLNNGGVGRFGYPISEVVVDGNGGPSRQYFRNGHFMIHNGGESVYGYDGPPPISGNTGLGNSGNNEPQSVPQILSYTPESGSAKLIANTNFRNYPWAEPSTLIQAISTGTTFTLLEKLTTNDPTVANRNWYRVRLNDGREGYFWADNIQKVASGVSGGGTSSGFSMGNTLIRTGGEDPELGVQSKPQWDGKELGDVWTKITPEPINVDKKHLVTINWGNTKWESTISLNKEGVILEYHKKFPDLYPRIVTVRALPQDNNPKDANLDKEFASVITSKTKIENKNGSNNDSNISHRNIDQENPSNPDKWEEEGALRPYVVQGFAGIIKEKNNKKVNVRSDPWVPFYNEKDSIVSSFDSNELIFFDAWTRDEQNKTWVRVAGKIYQWVRSDNININDSLPEDLYVLPYSQSSTVARDISVNMRAFLDTIAFAEGLSGRDGYKTIVGGSKFDSFDNHPNKLVNGSTAAGRYQFLKKTWDRIKKDINAQDFTPLNQDLAAVKLIEVDCKAKQLVENGQFEEAIRKCAPTWASLPSQGDSSYYPTQKAKPMEVLKKVYEGNLKKYKS